MKKILERLIDWMLNEIVSAVVIEQKDKVELHKNAYNKLVEDDDQFKDWFDSQL